jgi:hypothetical protein
LIGQASVLGNESSKTNLPELVFTGCGTGEVTEEKLEPKRLNTIKETNALAK